MMVVVEWRLGVLNGCHHRGHNGGHYGSRGCSSATGGLCMSGDAKISSCGVCTG